jgi:hypothetical protein
MEPIYTYCPCRILLARVIDFSAWATVEFGSQSIVRNDIDTSLNNTYVMHRFIFDNLDTLPKDYNLKTTIYLFSENTMCSHINVGYVDTQTVETTTPPFSTTTASNNNGERVSALCWSIFILFIGLLYYAL